MKSGNAKYRGAIIGCMARGWESKSVEEQQSEAAQISSTPRARMTLEEAARRRQKEGLLLSRQRVLQQLESSQDARHRKLLDEALAALNEKLAEPGQ